MPFDYENDTLHRRLRALPRWFWENIRPDDPTRNLASTVIVATVLVIAIILGASLDPGLGKFADMIVGASLILFLAALAGLFGVWAIRFMHDVPRFIGWRGLQALIGLTVILLFLLEWPKNLSLILGLGFGLAEALLIAQIFVILSGRLGESGRLRKTFSYGVVLVGISANIFVLQWFIRAGYDDHLQAYRPPPVHVDPIDAPDPSQPGPYDVNYLTYGSGDDRNRPEFAADADIVVDTVAASSFVEGRGGWRSRVRENFWGFDFDEFPLNGRVWHPKGDGPFPLVLIVHGNHGMTNFSDPGYEYLGQHLASRGYILASIDENFLNGGFAGNLKVENDCRGWMLLKHLEQWRAWANDPESIFHNKIDLESIGLIGHSRGGEAAAIAAAFNKLDRYPDDATVEFDFDFNIKAVIAIAPSDGQYNPANHPTPLNDVSYFVIQGGHDADVSEFLGDRQYNRVNIEEDAPHFKASLFVYRANHGQFNTEWGATDFSFPFNLQLNLRPLLDGEDQRQIAKVYFTSFLDTTLKADLRYKPIFEDYRAALQWLPEDYYINRYQDGTYRCIADFDEDIDVTSTTIEGGSITGKNLALWRERHLPFREGGTKRDSVVYLGWRQTKDEATPSYTIDLPDDFASKQTLDESWSLTFSLSPTDEKVPKISADKGEKGVVQAESKEYKKESVLSFSVQLISGNGETATLPIDQFRAVLPTLASRFTKLRKESDRYGKEWEPTLQSFKLPLAAFRKANPNIQVDRLTAIRIVFDQTPEGALIFDEIGFTR